MDSLSRPAPADDKAPAKGVNVEVQNLVHSAEGSNDFAYGTSVATSAPHVRLGFMRKVYGILAAQLAMTTFICAAFMLVAPLRNFVLAGAGVLNFISMIGTFGSLFGLMAYKDTHPTNMYILAAFTGFESVLVGTLCATYASAGLSYLVLEALVITLSIFSGLTLYCFVSKKDFSFMGGALFACLLALIGCSVVNLVLGVTGNQSPMLAFLISWGGAVLFSLFILYDTSLIMHRLSPDEVSSTRVVCFLANTGIFAGNCTDPTLHHSVRFLLLGNPNAASISAVLFVTPAFFYALFGTCCVDLHSDLFSLFFCALSRSMVVMVLRTNRSGSCQSVSGYS